MLNKEFYKDLFVEAAAEGDKIALNNCTKEPVLCSTIGCSRCVFDEVDHCIKARREWANKEYTEPRIHWEDVPVDTPVYVHIADGRPDTPRHFASYDDKAETIRVFIGGKTSFTIINKHDVMQDTSEYFESDVTLARKEDMEKYYRR